MNTQEREDSTMNTGVSRAGCYLRWGYELLFSIYLAALVVSVNRMVATYSLALRLRSLYVSYRFPHVSMGIDDYRGIRVTSFLLVWLLVILFFITFRLLADGTFAKIVLRVLTGVVAIAGLPVAHIYSGHPTMFFLKAELILSVGCIILYAYRKWPVSDLVSLLLLVLHFGVWTWVIWDSFSLGLDALWPAWDSWYISKETRLAYALLGFASTFFWAAYIRQPSRNSAKETAAA